MLHRIMLVFTLILLITSSASIKAQAPQTLAYDIGQPIVRHIWIDAVHGDDSRTGNSETEALRTLDEAWNRIPMGVPLETGYHIHLLSGDYTSSTPVYMESRYGTYEFPIIIEAMPQTATFSNLNVYDTRYIYFIGLTVQGGGDVWHCEKCDHVLVRDLTIIGADPATYNVQEALKVNQSQYIYIENSDISGAWDNAVDFVAVQYGHIVNNKIHNAGDWCLYLKGGSAYFRVEGNEFFECGTGGFTAGQGTGFEFMVAPWLQYEAYDIKFIHNVVHDAEGAGAGVNGGYNILIAYNTFYRIGARSHIFEVVFGLRTCDGNTEQCASFLNRGGWGTTVIGNEEPIPNQNVFVYNNIFYNPAGYQSQWQHFTVLASHIPSDDSNIPSPAMTDDNLQIRGNLIWNGDSDMPLGIAPETGCQDDNPTCNLAQLLQDNLINTVEPQLANPENGDYTVTIDTDFMRAIPDFSWELDAIPVGNMSNALES